MAKRKVTLTKGDRTWTTDDPTEVTNLKQRGWAEKADKPANKSAATK